MRAFPTITTHSLVAARPELLVFLTLAIPLLFWLLIQGPILMNDGPVHLNFTRVLFFPGSLGPLQSAVFHPAMKIEQNLLLYFILGAFIPLVGPPTAEALVQWFCFVGPVAAAMWTCATIRRDNLWVGLLIAPMAINQMLFLGLYSFTLSCIVFLIVMGLAVRCVRRPGPALSAGLLAMLVLAFLSHAAGFLMALCAVGLLLAHATLFGWRARGTPPWRLLWPIGALVVAGCMELAMLLTHSGDPTRYGEIGVLYRVSHLPTLHLLWINGLQHVFPLAFSATLLGCAALALLRRLRDRDGDNRMLWGLIAAVMGLVVLQLIVPDTAGSGWGHARRFEVGPWMGFVLCLAALPMSRRMIWACAGATAVLLGAQAQAMLSMQDEVDVQQRAFLAADRLIGAHCTVAPVILEPGLIPNDPEIRVPASTRSCRPPTASSCMTIGWCFTISWRACGPIQCISGQARNRNRAFSDGMPRARSRRSSRSTLPVSKHGQVSRSIMCLSAMCRGSWAGRSGLPSPVSRKTATAPSIAPQAAS